MVTDDFAIPAVEPKVESNLPTTVFCLRKSWVEIPMRYVVRAGLYHSRQGCPYGKRVLPGSKLYHPDPLVEPPTNPSAARGSDHEGESYQGDHASPS
ncbi:hypothetical protein JTB14_009180 [Gonioctena quinquepunctata]|nr:hypothetical protein JTB14_009180 [Gonioctena quinquepunctata]